MEEKEFIKWCNHQHDIVCNQKYNGNLPYSFHLMCVAKQVHKFFHHWALFSKKEALYAAYGHDLIEDARVTYNDITEKLVEFEGSKDLLSIGRITSAIYGCTESTGRNREERHDDAYFNRLTASNLAVFVKLCDISANITFGLLTNSTMVKKYRIEFPEFIERLSPTLVTDNEEIIAHIKKLLDI